MEEQVPLTIAAVILAGGQSSRMGQHKALLPFRGTTFLSLLITQLQPMVSQVFVGGSPEKDLYVGIGVDILSDPEPFVGAGPLAGLLAALNSCDSDLLLCVPCDNPQLPANLVSKLIAAMEKNNADLVYVDDGESEYPLYALLKTSLRQSLQDYLQAGEKRVFGWIKMNNSKAVNFSAERAYFCNINSAAEYQQFIDKT